VDIIGPPHTEDDGTKENAGGEHRPELKAHRRCYSAEGFQSWVIARFASLIRAILTYSRQFKSLIEAIAFFRVFSNSGRGVCVGRLLLGTTWRPGVEFPAYYIDIMSL